MTEKDGYLEIDLKLLFQALLSKALVIGLAGVVCGIIALLYTLFLVSPKYEANTLLYVNNTSLSQGSTSAISSSELSTAQKLVNTYLVILESRTTLDEVIEQTGVDYTHNQLKRMITAASVNSTEVFEVVVTSTDPEEAATLANAIADILPDKIAAVVNGSSVRVVDRAVVAKNPISPSKMKNTAMGILLGGFAAAVIVVLREVFNESITSEDYLTRTYEKIPLLAVIPDAASQKGSRYYRSYESMGYKRSSVKTGGEE